MVIIDKFESRPIALVYLDIDETITRWKDVRSFLQKALNYLGVPYKEEYLNGLFLAMQDRETTLITTGIWDEQCYSYYLEERIPVLREYGHTGEELRTIMYEMESEETYISSEVKSEIEKLAKLYKLVCYTNWSLAQARKKIDKYDLSKYFETIYTPEIIFSKHTKTGFLHLAYANNIAPSKIAHVGDSRSEIRSAKGAGCAAIYLDYGIKNEDDITKERMKTILAADASVNSFSDIRKVLTKK